MQEKADRVFVSPRSQQFGERQQVIVVHPDRVFRSDQRRQGFGEMSVHPEIAVKIDRSEFGQIDPVVEDRPQHPVGEPVVIFLKVGRRQVQST